MILVVLAIAIALVGGFLMGYLPKHRRARAEGFLAGRLFERREILRAVREVKAREGQVPEGVRQSYR